LKGGIICYPRQTSPLLKEGNFVAECCIYSRPNKRRAREGVIGEFYRLFKRNKEIKEEWRARMIAQWRSLWISLGSVSTSASTDPTVNSAANSMWVPLSLSLKHKHKHGSRVLLYGPKNDKDYGVLSEWAVIFIGIYIV
jgi:hypothetical protein